MHRTFARRIGDAECLLDQFGNAISRWHGHSLFGDRREQRLLINLLEGIAMHVTQGQCAAN